jgi:hypothetical protein
MTTSMHQHTGDGGDVVKTLPLLAMAGVTLVAAVWGGLGRMGWTTLRPPSMLTLGHGVLVANGFFGTVIPLERAVALDRTPLYLVPLASVVGSWLAMLGWPLVGAGLVTLASTGFVAMFVWLITRDSSLHHVVMGLSALAWAGASALLCRHAAGSGGPVAGLAPWWAAFLILTIAGERLELARMLQLDRLQRGLFVAAVGALLAGTTAHVLDWPAGLRVTGAGCLGLAGWLGLWDVARRTASQEGLAGYIGRVLLSGYVWLAVGGVLLVGYGPTSGGLIFDAQWHAIFVGFVLSMIFAHAPVVVRALTGWQIPCHSILYLAPVLLHASLVVRLVGDLGAAPGWRLAGGLGNALAIVLFALVAASRLTRES